jgi:hypothetical protein
MLVDDHPGVRAALLGNDEAALDGYTAEFASGGIGHSLPAAADVRPPWDDVVRERVGTASS